MNSPLKTELVPSTRFLIGAWGVFGIMLLILLGHHDVNRAQEARVLETARQMLDADWRGWLIPTLNGEPRLRKPPLCYWYTAMSYRLFGVNEFAGRLPTLLIGWLAVGVTFLLARDIAGNRVPTARDLQRGFFAAVALATSFFFIRYARSAETDAPTMLGTAAAFWAILRSQTGSKQWLHLAAAGMALSALTKGPPAIYPLVFMAILSIAARSTALLRRFVTSGAVATAAVLSLTWWLYVVTQPAGEQVADELRVIATGFNHFGLFYEYVPKLMGALLPWTPFYLAGFLLGLFEWKKDATFRTIVYAIMSVFLPLAIMPQVQPHYLLPMLPACAALVAWTIVRVLNAELDSRWTSAMRWVFRGTLLAFLMAAPVALSVSYGVKRRLGFVDVMAVGALFASAMLVLTAFRQRPAALQMAAWACALLLAMPIVAGWWMPTLIGTRSRDAARDITLLYGRRPMLSYGGDASIGLNFNLRRTILHTPDPAVVRKFVEANPDAVIIVERDPHSPSRSPVPGLLEESATFKTAKDTLDLFTRPERRVTTTPHQ